MTTSVDPTEVAKFDETKSQWWDTNGPLKTLHDINPARLQWINEVTPLQDKRVLDVGCGGGLLSEGMAKMGAHVTAVDANESAISAAIAHLNTSGLKIDYRATLIEDLDDTQYPIITCLEMLEHVPHPQHIIQECAKRLETGGTLFLSTLNRTVTAYAKAILGAEYILGILPRQTHDYKKFIKPSELRAMLQAAGLVLEQIKGLDYNPFSRMATLTDDVSVNYLVVARKEDDAAI